MKLYRKLKPILIPIAKYMAVIGIVTALGSSSSEEPVMLVTRIMAGIGLIGLVGLLFLFAID